MAKEKKEPTIDELALEQLLVAMDAKNENYSTGIEAARLDAAELILKFATPGEQKAKDAALGFLHRAMIGKISTLGAQLRARAAGIIIRHARGTL